MTSPQVGHADLSPDYKSSQETLFDGVQLKPWQRPSIPLADPATNSPGLVHEHSTDTERNAAALIAPRTGSLRSRALHAIRRSENGLTMYEIAAELDALLYSIAPRLTELRDAGWIFDSSRRRITPSGALAIVWVLSPRGREELS